MIDILQITPQNAHVLDAIAPDVFDADILPAHLAGFLAQANHFIAVAVADGITIGQIRSMVQHQPDAPPVLYIDNLGVAPAHQRQGIARRLVEHALTWGAAQACAEAWVATELVNHPALALYHRYESAPMEPVAYCRLRIEMGANP